MTIALHIGDCRAVLATLPAASVHCVVTSPPYWGLRDYGVAGQLGMEASLGEYVDVMVGVLREVRRVLRDDGTLWLNMGDSYATSINGRSAHDTKAAGNDDRTFRDKPFTTITPDWKSRVGQSGNKGNGGADHGFRISDPVLKPKDLCGIPWRVAFALQADGWYLRQDIIWSKPNPMPESVTDRCTKAHEYLFLLSKRERYYYDAEAIAEVGTGRETFFPATPQLKALTITGARNDGDSANLAPAITRNKRSVWEVTTAPFSEAHFATFPPALIEPCIKAGTSEKGCCGKCGKPWVRQVKREQKGYLANGNRAAADVRGVSLSSALRGNGRDAWTQNTTLGWSPACACAADPVPCTVLDPFGGAGTTGLVADRLQRNAILIELNPAYAAMSSNRIKDDAPLFAEVAQP
jgi:DNA modification methylase